VKIVLSCQESRSEACGHPKKMNADSLGSRLNRAGNFFIHPAISNKAFDGPFSV